MLSEGKEEFDVVSPLGFKLTRHYSLSDLLGDHCKKFTLYITGKIGVSYVAAGAISKPPFLDCECLYSSIIDDRISLSVRDKAS